jgi:hypothetical protein
LFSPPHDLPSSWLVSLDPANRISSLIELNQHSRFLRLGAADKTLQDILGKAALFKIQMILRCDMIRNPHGRLHASSNANDHSASSGEKQVCLVIEDLRASRAGQHGIRDQRGPLVTGQRLESNAVPRATFGYGPPRRCVCGSSGAAVCGAGGVMAWERGRGEGARGRGGR